uniref:Immunoglobulin V-set domain-containing protein n=1 Tax=Anguilla anguilla TaxID=7936 RepID=A0A0E9XJZ8_ANGAN
MEWRKNNTNVILLVSGQDNSTFTTRETNAAFKGRLIVNNETGALNISSLRGEDSGEYDFTGLDHPRPLGQKRYNYTFMRGLFQCR